MANAKVETVTKTVAKEVEEEVVQLTLSKEEATTIYGLLSRVSGSPETTYRKHTAAVRGALGKAGIYAYGGEYFSANVPARSLPGTFNLFI